MKISVKVGALVLIIVLLSATQYIGQDSCLRRLEKGIEHIAQGEFDEAKVVFEKMKEDYPEREAQKLSMWAYQDLIDGKVKCEAAISISN